MFKFNLPFVFSLFLTCFNLTDVQADTPPGLSPEGLLQIRTVLRRDVAKDRIPGAVVLLAQDGKIVMHEAFGHRRAAPGEKLTTDSVFQLYSMIKPLVSTAAMILVEQGKLRLDDPLAKYIPAYEKMQVAVGFEAQELAVRPILIEDLLLHTSGLTYGFFGIGPARRAYRQTCLDCARDLAELADMLAGLPLEHQPGEIWEYSRAIDVLARVVEVVAGESLDRFLKTRIFQPLDMTSTGFGTRDGRAVRLAGGQVTENPSLLRGGQLLASARDYFRFAQAMLDDGAFEGARLLKPETVALMRRDHLARRDIEPGKYLWKGRDWGFGYGFGVQTAPLSNSARLSQPPGTLFWSGFGGTHFWIDPANRIVAVFMMSSSADRRHYMRLLRRLVYLGRE